MSLQIPTAGAGNHPTDHAALHTRYNAEQVILPGDGYTEIQTALDTIKAAGGGMLRLMPGAYNIGTNTLKYQHGHGLVIQGTSSVGGCQIVGAGAAIILDFIGSFGCALRDVRINTSAACEVGILLARDTTNKTSNSFRFDNVQVYGEFSKAAVYSINSETNIYTGSYIRNISEAENSYAFYTSTENDLGVTSTGGIIAQSADSCTNSVLTVWGGSFTHYGTNGISVGLRGICRVMNFYGSYIYSELRGVHIGPSSAQNLMNGPITFDGCSFEGLAGSQAIYLDDGLIYGLQVERNLFAITGAADYNEIRQVECSAGNGLSISKIRNNRHSAANPVSLSRLFYSEIGDCNMQVRDVSMANEYVNVLNLDLTGESGSSRRGRLTTTQQGYELIA